jgi:predicted histidine transporter YuiF (NhaC family)
MTFTITWQSLITTGGVLTALGIIVGLLAKVFRFFDRQKQQDKDIKALEKRDTDDNNLSQEQLQLLTWGVLACLKGLKEQGCNGPVTEAIKKIEKKLNEKAHHREEH